MRNILTYVLYVAIPLLVLSGCNKPRNIPEAKLEQIVYEVFLANAYADMNNSVFSRDTFDIYTPILAKYGYKPTDLKHTIQGYSKRKNTRFADVIDVAMYRLESESAAYNDRVAMRDSVDRILADRYRKEVYRRDSLKAYTRPSETDVPDLSIDVRPGRYTVDFRYFVDTTLRRSTIQYRHYLEDGKKYRSGYFTRNYRRGEWIKENLEVTVNSGSSIETLNLNFANAVIRDEERNRRFRVEIDSLVIWHYLPKEAARDSFIREALPFFNPDDLIIKHDGPEIIIPLRPDTTGTDTAGGN